MVRQFQLAATFAFLHIGGDKRMVRTALIALHRGGFTFRNSHFILFWGVCTRCSAFIATNLCNSLVVGWWRKKGAINFGGVEMREGCAEFTVGAGFDGDEFPAGLQLRQPEC